MLDGRDVMQLSAEELVTITKVFPQNSPPSASRSSLTWSYQTGYVLAAQFCPQQTFAKLSLLALYYRIFNVNRKFVICVYAIGGIQLGWGIGTYVAHWAECTPIAHMWDRTIPGTCLNNTYFLVVGETINSLIDFALVGLAVWIVQSLQMKTSVKLKLSVIFALGGL